MRGIEPYRRGDEDRRGGCRDSGSDDGSFAGTGGRFSERRDDAAEQSPDEGICAQESGFPLPMLRWQRGRTPLDQRPETITEYSTDRRSALRERPGVVPPIYFSFAASRKMQNGCHSAAKPANAGEIFSCPINRKQRQRFVSRFAAPGRPLARRACIYLKILGLSRISGVVSNEHNKANLPKGFMATFLITGGAGFIGSHLTEALLALGHRVLVMDDLSSGSMDNLADVRNHKGLEFVPESVMEKRVLAELVDRADMIFHLAATVGVFNIIDSPVTTIMNNIGGTECVLKMAAKKKKKVLVASTSEVYGKSTALPSGKTPT